MALQKNLWVKLFSAFKMPELEQYKIIMTVYRFSVKTISLLRRSLLE